EYILSFWSTDNAGAFLDVSLIGSNYGNYIPTTVTNTVGSWKLRTARFTAAAGDYVELRNVPGTGATPSVFIDEVRLYPAGAAMTTYTYKPLLGMGSACDADNYITYYEYDAMGRP